MSGQSIFVHSFSFYIPKFRLRRDEEGKQAGVKGVGAKPFCGPDEDTITMAYETAWRTCEIWGKTPDVVLFVSSTPEYTETSPALILSNALDLPQSTAFLTLTGGNSSFVSALFVASSFAREGKNVLVILSEKKVSRNLSVDFFLADGSASFVVSGEEGEPKGAVLKLKDVKFFSEMTYDGWIEVGDGFLKLHDERHFANVQIPELLKGLSDYIKKDGAFITSAPTFATKRGLDKILKVKDEVALAGVFGVAHPVLSLIYNLSNLPKSFLTVVVGSGAGFCEFEVIEKDDNLVSSLLAELSGGKSVNFGTYLKFRGFFGQTVPEEENSVPMLWREKNLRFWGQKCSSCGNVQFPRQNYCIVCGSDQLKPHKLSKRGEVFTFTEDYLTNYADVNPPLPMLVVQLDGGGRVYVQGTDGDRFKHGDKVMLTLRILNKSGGWKNCWWKAKKIE